MEQLRTGISMENTKIEYRSHDDLGLVGNKAFEKTGEIMELMRSCTDRDALEVIAVVTQLFASCKVGYLIAAQIDGQDDIVDECVNRFREAEEMAFRMTYQDSCMVAEVPNVLFPGETLQ